MNLIEPLKPLTSWIVIRLTEMRDVTLLSFYFSLPVTFFMNIMSWATSEANTDYVRIVLTAIAIDHILGTIAHSRFYKDDFSLIKNIGGLGIKILVVVTMGSLFEGLAELAITEDFVYRYLFFVTRILIFFYPARSAMKNCYIVTRGAFPPKVLMEKSDKFNNTLDINVFKKKEDNSEN